MNSARPLSRSSSKDSDNSANRRVSFASHAQVQESTTPFRRTRTTTTSSVPVKPFDGGTPRSYTPETFSDASSESGFYEIIEYDPSKQIMSFNLARNSSDDDEKQQSTTARNAWDGLEVEEEFVETAEAPFQIEDNTPAAEALRASASVRVSRVGKAARAVHMQAVRRLVKRATLTGKQGVVKGKPPRLPPRQLQDDGEGGGVHPDELSDLEEEDEQDGEADHDQSENDPSHQDMSSHHHYDGEPVVPDDVVQGTAEAGKKGKIFLASIVYYFDVVLRGFQMFAHCSVRF